MPSADTLCSSKLSYEKKIWKQGYKYIAGVDEAGRGPLAGPVVAAAVILPHDFLPKDIDDSKKLTSKKREELFHYITGSAVCCEVGIVEKEDIDRLNILKAALTAMSYAVNSLKIRPDFILIDGNQIIPGILLPQKFIIGGDSKSVSIASASIIAKVTRDKIMEGLDKKYPVYGFAQHKGYGTKLHVEAIKKYGLSPVHRTTFRVKSLEC